MSQGFSGTPVAIVLARCRVGEPTGLVVEADRAASARQRE
jgi:hypothetical protein